MPPHVQLLKFNHQGRCIGLNLNSIRDWANQAIPNHSHFYPAAQIQARVKRNYFDELKRQSRGIDPFTWLFDLSGAIEYLATIAHTIIAHDESRAQCDLHPHVNGEFCPNRLGIIFPQPYFDQP